MPHHARGMCQQHYDEYRKKNRRDKKPAETTKSCAVPGCNRMHHARGYCKMHYAKFVKSGKKPESEKPTVQSAPVSVSLPSPDEDLDVFLEKRLTIIRQRHKNILKKRSKKKAKKSRDGT